MKQLNNCDNHDGLGKKDVGKHRRASQEESPGLSGLDLAKNNQFRDLELDEEDMIESSCGVRLEVKADDRQLTRGSYSVKLERELSDNQFLRPSTSFNPSFDPTDRGGRNRHRSGGCLPDRLYTDESRHILRVSRDNVQPSSGSVHDLHGSPSSTTLDPEALEELDEIQPLPRRRANTNPEMKCWRRKLKSRMLNRPPTPPPDDCVVMKIGGDEEEGGLCREVSGVGESSDDLRIDGWILRRQSDSVAPDLPVIEEG